MNDLTKLIYNVLNVIDIYNILNILDYCKEEHNLTTVNDFKDYYNLTDEEFDTIFIKED